MHYDAQTRMDGDPVNVTERPTDDLARLSERELEVSRLLALGKTNKEIGMVLGISPRTVQIHVAHIFDKLGVHSRACAAVWLVEHDLGR
jgi:DNA-binding NarL/FixJ family response regulator